MPTLLGPFSTGPDLITLEITGSTVDPLTGDWSLDVGPYDLTGIIRSVDHERVVTSANIKPITVVAMNEVVVEIGDTMELEALKTRGNQQVLRIIRDTCTHIKVVWDDNQSEQQTGYFVLLGGPDAHAGLAEQTMRLRLGPVALVGQPQYTREPV